MSYKYKVEFDCLSKLKVTLKIILYNFILVVCFNSCSNEYRFAKLYNKYAVTGSFAVYSLNDDSYFYYGQDDFLVQTTPASTFKICNSLIGLETGVIPDENFVIPWDSVSRQSQEWNKDNDLKSAFKNSTVWYYQELARRVGEPKMKYWLDKCNYGNADTSGKIDWFWLSGGLKISPKEQIEFLKALYLHQLPFSKRNMDIVKKIMLVEKTPKYALYAKTGWGFDNTRDIGWYVGFVEANKNVYFFCNRVYCTDNENLLFPKSRTEITRKALKMLNILP